MQIQERPPGPDALLFLVLSPFIAAALGAGLGALVAWLMPAEDWSSWGWWLSIPAWLLLEIVFEAIVGIFGGYSKQARVIVAVSAFGGFYATWFMLS